MGEKKEEEKEGERTALARQPVASQASQWASSHAVPDSVHLRKRFS